MLEGGVVADVVLVGPGVVVAVAPFVVAAAVFVVAAAVFVVAAAVFVVAAAVFVVVPPAGGSLGRFCAATWEVRRTDEASKVR